MHTRTESLAVCGLGPGVYSLTELALVYSSKTEYTKGNPRFKYQTVVALGRSIATVHRSGPLSPRKHPREGVGDAESAGQGADTACQVYACWTALHLSLGMGRSQCPFTDINVIFRNHSKPGLIPERSNWPSRACQSSS